jgi:hypothetical protein
MIIADWRARCVFDGTPASRCRRTEVASEVFRDRQGRNPMDRFIARENIRHFRDRLWSEVDPDLRTQLKEFLVAEEDKLANALELLADIDRHISDGNHRIDRQRVLITTMERDGHNGIAHARTLLGCMMDTQLLSQEYRRRLLIRIEQNKL